MARTWLAIRVDLVSGRGTHHWPRPGRIFVAAGSHSFRQLGDAIDAAFARWDLAHMHMFTLADGAAVTLLRLWDGEAPEGSLDSDATKLSRLRPGDQFAYVFDFGMTGHTSARSPTSASTLSTKSASFLPNRCRTSAGGVSPTSTGAGGIATTKRHPRRHNQHLRLRIYHRSCRDGDHVNAGGDGQPKPGEHRTPR